MPDAAVTIKLNLEPGDVKKTAAELQREVKNIFDQTGGHGSRDMSALLLQLKQAYAELDKLTGELEKAQSTRVLDPENAQDLKILERDLRQAASEYAKITEQMQQMKAAGMENTAEFGKLRNSANLVAQSMERIKWEMEIVKEYAQVDANATEQAANAVDLQNDKISLLLQKYMELTAQPKKQSKAWDNVRKAISGVEKIAKKAMSKIRSGFDKVNHSIKHGIKNLMRYALGIRGAYMLVRKIRAAFKEGITNLAKFDSQANETLSSFTTDIQYMKNSLGAMLMPLAELVIPIFRNITDAVVKATESVSQFFAAFAGTGKVYKAIRVQKDFAESTEAAAATVNKSLAGYDKLQVISKASSSASSDDSTKAFELVEVEQKYQDLVSKIRDLWDAGDFKSLGESLGEGLNNSIEKADFEGFGVKINNAIIGALDFINGFFDTLDWASLGNKIGQGLKKIDWKSIVNKIIKFLSTLPKKLGQLFGQAFKDINPEFATGLEKFLTTFGDLVRPILDFVIQLIPPITTFIGFLLQGIGLLQQALQPLVEYLLGENGIGGFLQMILPAAGETIEKILELVSQIIEFLTPLLEPIIQFLTESSEILLGGIFEVLKEVAEVLVEVFGDLGPVSDILGWILHEILKPALQFLKNLISIIKEIVKVILNQVRSIKDKIGGFVEFIVKLFQGDLSGAFEGLKRSFRGTINGLINLLNGLITGINTIAYPLRNIILSIAKISGANWTIDEVKIPHIPLLAQGAVLPPNNPFLAMLGDQKSGTNVEAPLSTIKQAIREELNNMGGSRAVAPIILQVDGKTIAQVVWNENEKRYKQYGSYVPVY